MEAPPDSSWSAAIAPTPDALIALPGPRPAVSVAFPGPGAFAAHLLEPSDPDPRGARATPPFRP